MILAAIPRPPLANTTEFDRLLLEQSFEVSSKNCLENCRGRVSKRERAQKEIVDDVVIGTIVLCAGYI